MALINCPFCESKISDSASACPKCGGAITEDSTKNCPDCGHLNKYSTSSCKNCGCKFQKSGIKTKVFNENEKIIVQTTIVKRTGCLSSFFIMIGIIALGISILIAAVIMAIS
jgi:hypothetical protein